MHSLDASTMTAASNEPPPINSTHLPPRNAANDSPFLDEKQLCAHLRISSVTATKWRAQAAGPPFIKVGRLVRYRRADVEAWLLSRTIGK